MREIKTTIVGLKLLLFLFYQDEERNKKIEIDVPAAIGRCYSTELDP